MSLTSVPPQKCPPRSSPPSSSATKLTDTMNGHSPSSAPVPPMTWNCVPDPPADMPATGSARGREDCAAAGAGSARAARASTPTTARAAATARAATTARTARRLSLCFRRPDIAALPPVPPPPALPGCCTSAAGTMREHPQDGHIFIASTSRRERVVGRRPR